MPRKSRSVKISCYWRQFFPNRFWRIGDSWIQKMETPAPFYEGHLSLFIICRCVWHFVQKNVSYHRLNILYEEKKATKTPPPIVVAVSSGNRVYYMCLRSVHSFRLHCVHASTSVPRSFGYFLPFHSASSISSVSQYPSPSPPFPAVAFIPALS